MVLNKIKQTNRSENKRIKYATFFNVRVDQPLEGLDVKSGYKRRERSIHRTGHTMRKLKNNATATYRGQFSIHKVLKSTRSLTEETRKAVTEEFANYVDDGGLEAGYGMEASPAHDTRWNGKLVD